MEAIEYVEVTYHFFLLHFMGLDWWQKSPCDLIFSKAEKFILLKFNELSLIVELINCRISISDFHTQR